MDEDETGSRPSSRSARSTPRRARTRADAGRCADFAAAVARWERRLGELNVLVAPVEPPAPVSERIQGRPCGHADSSPASARGARRRRRRAGQSVGAEIVRMRRRMRRWRGLPTITRLIAACRVASCWCANTRPTCCRRAAPEPALQVVTADRQEAGRDRAQDRPRSAGPRPAQLVAVFQKEEQSPIRPHGGRREAHAHGAPVAAQRQPDRDFQIGSTRGPMCRRESLAWSARISSRYAPRLPRSTRAHRQRDLRRFAEPVGG